MKEERLMLCCHGLDNSAPLVSQRVQFTGADPSPCAINVEKKNILLGGIDCCAQHIHANGSRANGCQSTAMHEVGGQATAAQVQSCSLSSGRGQVLVLTLLSLLALACLLPELVHTNTQMHHAHSSRPYPGMNQELSPGPENHMRFLLRWTTAWSKGQTTRRCAAAQMCTEAGKA
eukprot:357001-Chlamydomonas_euryale.AAC.13